jgi:hypothetical protein
MRLAFISTRYYMLTALSKIIHWQQSLRSRPYDAVILKALSGIYIGNFLEKPYPILLVETGTVKYKCVTNTRRNVRNLIVVHRTKACNTGDNQSGQLTDKTICMLGTHWDDTSDPGNPVQRLEYDVHSLYGWRQAAPTMRSAGETSITPECCTRVERSSNVLRSLVYCTLFDDHFLRRMYTMISKPAKILPGIFRRILLR